MDGEPPRERVRTARGRHQDFHGILELLDLLEHTLSLDEPEPPAD
jgi:hypothetical protein